MGDGGSDPQTLVVSRRVRTWARPTARWGVALLAAVACAGADRARAATAPPTVSGAAMPLAPPSSQTSAPVSPNAAIAQYLQVVAAALAAPNATADRVLAAAGAADVDVQPFTVRFRPPHAALGRGVLLRDRDDPAGRPPEAVDFTPDSDRPPLHFAEVAAALGAWELVTGATSPRFRHAVAFTRPAATSQALGQQTVEVRLDAVLSADPADSTARVIRLGMRRDPLD